MYKVLSDISNFLSQPFFYLVNDPGQMPLLAAFLLGIIGALAPCQLTGNMSAITYYGNRTLQTKNQLYEASFFILGKIAVYSTLGLAAWLIGSELNTTITSFFSISRKVIGPFIFFLGLFLVGFFKLEWISNLTKRIPLIRREGMWGSFLMGVTFSIAFCPTMFVLFFVTLIPMMMQSSYGAILPTIFAVGTSLPLIIILLILWYLGANGSILKKSRKFGNAVQKTAGIILIITGLFDTITYWGL